MAPCIVTRSALDHARPSTRKARSCVRSAVAVVSQARARAILALVSAAAAAGANFVNAKIMYAVCVKSSNVSGGRRSRPPCQLPAGSCIPLMKWISDRMRSSAR